MHPWHTVTSALAPFLLFASMALLSRARPASYTPRAPTTWQVRFIDPELVP
ncbi:hypothetical protein [Streptomyces platensis]|uniref:hypothetical protein n=1 Tax=Streptomyces platensis TaxID=58346 RepID=UPI0036804A67